MNNKAIFIKTLAPLDAAYLAGFVDGAGCILAQLVHRENDRYKFKVRISLLFHQKTKRN